MYKKVEVVKVYIWGKYVGAVAPDPKLQFYIFEYDPKFVQTGIELAPLSMPLAQARAPFVFTDLPVLTYKRLPALLADALPDDFGNSLIDAWMGQKGVSKDAITALDRLAYMGKRGMGALEFKPARGKETKTTTAIQLSKLVETARLALHGDIGTELHAKAALAQLIQVGTSAGGARAKATIAWNKDTAEIRPGQFDVEAGFEHWLLKLDGMGNDRELGDSQNYGRIEYAYYLMAKASGITMSESRLLHENGRAHFMTKRFDRDQNSKHHIHTLCGMSHLDYKQKATHDYAQLFATMSSLGLGEEARDEAFRRMVFNVLSVNCDDHAKNTSFMLKEAGKWQLAPAYDLTHAYRADGAWTHQHLMSVNGKFAGITRDDCMMLADRFGIGRASKIYKEISQAISGWREYAAAAGLPESEAHLIAGQLSARPA